MSGATINLIGPSSTPGAPQITRVDQLNTPINLAFAAEAAARDGAVAAETAARAAADAVLAALVLTPIAAMSMLANPTGGSALPAATTLGTGLAFTGTALGLNGALPASTAITQNGSTILNSFGAGAGDGTVMLIGKGAGASLPNNALNMVAIGFNALGSDTQVNSENVAIGWGALRSVTTGQFSTAVGLNAGGQIITDTSNTLFGCDAMRDSTGGFNVVVGDGGLRDGAHTKSVAVGHAAMSAFNATTANTSDNVAIGYFAMSSASITTASGNTAVGSQAGLAITTGASNSVYGFNAGTAITTGSSNVLIGAASGFRVNTGGNNIAIGPSTLQFVTTGAFNVAIGRIALQNAGAGAGFHTGLGDSAMANFAGIGNTAANGNVAVGAQTMRGTAGATFNSNTAVGSQAGSVMSTGSSNTFLGINTALIATTAAINTIIGANVASTTFGTGTGNILIGVDSSTDTAAVGTSDTAIIKGRSGGTPILSSTGTNATPTTIMGGILGVSPTTGLTAHAGGTQAAALALTTGINNVTVCATSGDSVRLPVSVAGMQVTVINAGAASAQVYGAGTDTINGVATATGVALTNGKTAMYSCPVAGQWFGGMFA